MLSKKGAVILPSSFALQHPNLNISTLRNKEKVCIPRNLPFLLPSILSYYFEVEPPYQFRQTPHNLPLRKESSWTITPPAPKWPQGPATKWRSETAKFFTQKSFWLKYFWVNVDRRVVMQ